MRRDLKKALARVQSDYGFFVACQTDPALALAGYDLSTSERSAFSSPVKLAELLERGLEASRLVIKISGTHDWVNRVGPVRSSADDANRDRLVARQVDAVKRATDRDERTDAAFRLMDLIG